MYINLNNFICFMDSYSNAYLSPENYICYYEHDLSDNEKKVSLLIPQINESGIAKQFIVHMKNNKLNKLLDTDAHFLNRFHIQINDLSLYDQWIAYRKDYYIQAAIEWCEANQINYTIK